MRKEEEKEEKRSRNKGGNKDKGKLGHKGKEKNISVSEEEKKSSRVALDQHPSRVVCRLAKSLREYVGQLIFSRHPCEMGLLLM
jgi:hypothetical protein